MGFPIWKTCVGGYIKPSLQKYALVFENRFKFQFPHTFPNGVFKASWFIRFVEIIIVQLHVVKSIKLNN